MNLLLEFTIKISLVVGVGLLAASLLHRRSASLRHWMLAASLAAALATPLLVQWAPAWRLPVVAPVQPNAGTTAAPGTTNRREPRIAITTSAVGRLRVGWSGADMASHLSLLIDHWAAGTP